MTLLIGCGARGRDGKDSTSQGPKGDPGNSCIVTPTPTGAVIVCGVTTANITNGTEGKDAVPCNVIAVPNGAYVSCPDGSHSTILNGANGINATPVTIVKFCPGDTHYADEFNEVGLCIGGTIYAVYSANDGFLTKVPSGRYSSIGINSTCNFTITSNCGVTE